MTRSSHLEIQSIILVAPGLGVPKLPPGHCLSLHYSPVSIETHLRKDFGVLSVPSNPHAHSIPTNGNFRIMADWSRKQPRRAAEMALTVKNLPHRHEDLSLSPRIYLKRPSKLVYALCVCTRAHVHKFNSHDTPSTKHLRGQD